MSSKWTEYGPISDTYSVDLLANLCIGKFGVQTGPFGSQLHQKDYVANGTPIITVEHLGENRIVHKNLPRVSDDDKKRLDKYCLAEGDIVFSRVGSVDRRALVSEREDGWLFSGRCLRVRPKKEILDPTYLSYFLGTEGFKKYIRSIAVGATMPSINTNILSNVPIYYPSIAEQKGIARILTSLDEKIELNQRMNETLEAIAQAIFKCWFVDFEPTRAKMAGESDESICKRLKITPDILALFPDNLVDSDLGPIPKGWIVNPLEKYLTIKRGGSPRPIKDFIVKNGLPWVKIADATRNDSPFLFQTRECIKEEGLKKTVLLKSGSLILSNSATPGLPRFLQLDACIHDGWLHFPERHQFSKEYLYLLFLKIRNELISKGSGSVFTNLKTDILKQQLLVDAGSKILKAFDEQAFLIFTKLKKGEEESRILNQIRDTLLPKLLSGEIAVADAAASAEVA